MSVEKLAQQCWFATCPGGEDYGNLIHYGTQAAANRASGKIAGEDPGTVVEIGRHPALCWTVACDGACGEDYRDGEYEWALHFPGSADAEQELRDGGWVILQDGRVFCDADVPCDSSPEVAAAIPGQEALPGLGEARDD